MAVNATEHSPIGQAFSTNRPSFHEYPDFAANLARMETMRQGREPNQDPNAVNLDFQAPTKGVKQFILGGR